jgi:hypothetical protein
MQLEPVKPELEAPCGINCGVCKWYLAFSRGVHKERVKVNHCAGCRPRDKKCFTKRGCKKLQTNQVNYCFECADLPCKNLARLDKRYRERYRTSLVGNLKELKQNGMEQFLKDQALLFRCPSCGDVVSVHDRKCYACGKTAPLQP